MKKSHGVDQEDNSEWFKSSDPKAIRNMYGDLKDTVGQRANVGSKGVQDIDSAVVLEGDDV